MAYSAIPLTALALGAAAYGPKWVPLNSVNYGPPKKAESTVPAPPPPPVAVATGPSVAAPPPVRSEPVAAQVPPIVPVMPAYTSQRPLQITCIGAGTASKFAYVGGSSSGTFSGFAGTTMISGTVSGSSSAVIPRDRRFADQVDIRLFNGDDRIRLPRTMLPGIHGGDHGWFKLKDVVADARSIRASAAINLINNPKVYIDRVTGTISISGKAGDYSGECQVIDASAPKF